MAVCYLFLRTEFYRVLVYFGDYCCSNGIAHHGHNHYSHPMHLQVIFYTCT